MSTPEVSIVIPVFNEEGNLVELTRQIGEAMEPSGIAYEVILVDDGSTDGSLALLGELAAADPRLAVLRLVPNQGQSAALAAGFRRARGEVVVTLDADLQNDPADIPALLAELPGCDLVSGVRAKRRDSWVRHVSSRIANGVRRRVLADGITDVGCSLKAYRAEYLRRVPAFKGMHRFLPALVQMQGARVKEVPVGHRPRFAGEAKYGIGNRLWRGLADLLGVVWLRRRWIDPRLEEAVESSDMPASGGTRSSGPSKDGGEAGEATGTSATGSQ